MFRAFRVVSVVAPWGTTIAVAIPNDILVRFVTG